MPRIRFSLPPSRPPREHDYGYLFALCRDAGLFCIKSPRHGGSHATVHERGRRAFTGPIAKCVAYVKERAALTADVCTRR